MNNSPFDHRQDKELGEALRSALSGQDDAAFVQTVVARAALLQDRADDGGDWLEILTAWARPGLAAAAIGLAAAATMWWTGNQGPSETTMALADPLEASGEIPAEFLETQAPDLNDVLALELGN